MSNIEQPEQTETAEQPETMDLATAQRVEQEKLTRRAALRKLGFGAGMAAFALLGVDDFARMVGKRMERMAGDNKVAEQVAKEFQGMGIAMAAAPYNCTHNYDCSGCVGAAAIGSCCYYSSDPSACCGKDISAGDSSDCLTCCNNATGAGTVAHSNCLKACGSQG